MIIIYLILLCYTFFIIWLLNGYKYSIKSIKDNNYYPFVSIIIAAKDEADNLPLLIKCLQNQDYPKSKYEIIIINDKSTDNSDILLREYSTKIDNLEYINIFQTPKNWSSKKWALHNGIIKAKGDIILQTDADCLVSENWILAMSQQFQDLNISFVSGIAPLTGDNTLIGNLVLMDSIAQDIFSGYAIGNNLIFSCAARSIAYRKHDFIKIKGYHEINHIDSGDDDLLLHKMIHYLGGKVKYILAKSAASFSQQPKTLKQFINQRLRFASKGFLYYQKQFISNELKLVLPFLFLINLLVAILIIKFCSTGSAIFFIPILLKIIPDYFMLYPIYEILNFRWNWISYFILVIMHPFYIILFGLLGPICNFKWK